MHARLSTVFAATTVALLLSTAPAPAEVLNFSVQLSGAAEVPPNDSTGTGEVSADYDTDTKLFKWVITYKGLTGPATAAHFHGPAGPSENAPPVLPIEEADLGQTAEAASATTTQDAPAATTEAPAEAASSMMTADAPAAAAEAEPATPAEPAEPAAEPAAPADADPATTMEAAPQTTNEDEPTYSIIGEATLTDEQAADLRAGMWYFNIHTAQYPDGELRGQLPMYAE